ncbi:MAG: TlpA family protein disulfide reductase [Pyrinomonadaceae bacterium]|nr:TlpA family protein disulfide reductase [Pyrinomonadaceae bacterium]
MTKKALFLVFLLLFASSGVAQSGRPTGSNGLGATNDLGAMSSAELFTKAENYLRDKFTELEVNKVPYSEDLERKVRKEQKLLAAKYAAEIASRTESAPLDYYYQGRLHWIAGNRDRAAVSLATFLQRPGDTESVKTQNARALIVDVTAKKGEVEAAEVIFGDYLKTTPKKNSEIASMHKQLALSYTKKGSYEEAAAHAGSAFETAKTLLFEFKSRAKALNVLLDAGITAFEGFRRIDESEKAIASLTALRQYAAKVNSHSVYYRAVDEHIRYLIDIGKRMEGLKLYDASFITLDREIENNSVKTEIRRKLAKRKTHYKILGTRARTLGSIYSVMPGKVPGVASNAKKQIDLSDFEGKVVLLDFWATWCGPCYQAFPKLVKWQNDLSADGLVILGMTRFYAEDKSAVGKRGELKFLREFKEKWELNYPFIVASNQTNQINYGALSLPTAVLIDRKGNIRYIESGTSKSRLVEIEKMILTLLEE